MLLTVVRVLYAALGIAAVVMTANTLREALEFRGFDPIVVIGFAIGILLVAAALLVRRSGPVPRALTWLGIGALLAVPAWLLFSAVTGAQSALGVALVPAAIAVVLALVMARGRVATDALPVTAAATR